MKAHFHSALILSALICVLQVQSGEFGEAPANPKIIPPLEVFGKSASAFSFENRFPDAKKMLEAGEFHVSDGNPTYEVDVELENRDLMDHRIEFLLTVLPDKMVAARFFDMRAKSNEKNPNTKTISEVTNKSDYRYYITERIGGNREIIELRAVISNLAITYIILQGNKPIEMAENFLKNYVAFLKGNTATSGKLIPIIPERTWTSNAGKEMKGSILSFDQKKNSVAFLRFDGKTFPAIPLDSLSPADQKLIREEVN